MNYKPRHEFLREKEFVLATFKKRLFAFLIDFIVLILFYSCIMILFSLFNLHISNINVLSIFHVELEMDNAPPFLITCLKILFGLLPILYFSLSLYFSKGQTIGKYFLKIKVLSLHHEHIGLWHCIERSLGYFASALEFGFGFIQAFWNPNRMMLHDKIGETIVIACLDKKSNKKTTD